MNDNEARLLAENILLQNVLSKSERPVVACFLGGGKSEIHYLTPIGKFKIELSVEE